MQPPVCVLHASLHACMFCSHVRVVANSHKVFMCLLTWMSNWHCTVFVYLRQAVSGFFGMNLDWDGFGQSYFVPVAIGTVVGSVSLLVIFFAFLWWRRLLIF